MNSISINPSSFLIEWELPRNKSFSNRALVAACLSSQKIILRDIPSSTDVRSMVECLKKVGIEISVNENELTIDGHIHELPKVHETVELYTGEGGTTLRFLMPLLARTSNPYLLKPEGGMVNRPMDELCRILRELGVDVRGSGSEGFFVQGPFLAEEGTFDIDCSETTQFLSGLRLATWDTDLFFRAKDLSASLLYLQQTDHVIQLLQKKSELQVPVDFSSASYPLCLGAIRGPLLLTNCFFLDEDQADSCFVDILNSQIGAQVEFTGKGLRVTPPADGELRPFQVDGRYSPDLVPTLAVIACFCNGTTRLNHLEVLQHKETDRLEEIQHVLRKLGVDFLLLDNKHLEIRGQTFKGEQLFRHYRAPRDHRMIMMVALFFALFHGGEIENARYVDKSFPAFFRYLSPSQ